MSDRRDDIHPGELAAALRYLEGEQGPSPPLQASRIEKLEKERDEWKARAEKAAAELDMLRKHNGDADYLSRLEHHATNLRTERDAARDLVRRQRSTEGWDDCLEDDVDAAIARWDAESRSRHQR